MPEKVISSEDAIKLRSWLPDNASLLYLKLSNGASSWSVGKTKEPVVIRPKNPPSKQVEVHYPTGLESKLSESGVIFDAPEKEGYRNHPEANSHAAQIFAGLLNRRFDEMDQS